MKSKLIIVSSITYALKAKSELENHSIGCRIEKIKSIPLVNGCGYGIKVHSSDSVNAVRIIKNAGIRVIDLIDEGSERT